MELGARAQGMRPRAPTRLRPGAAVQVLPGMDFDRVFGQFWMILRDIKPNFEVSSEEKLF